MSNPNTVLTAWQLTLMAVVAVGALAVWLIAVYRADRNPRWRGRPAAGSPGGADTGQESAARQAAGSAGRHAA